MELERRKNACARMESQVQSINRQLFAEQRVELLARAAESLEERETRLRLALNRARAGLTERRVHEQTCRMLEEQLKVVCADVSNPEQFQIEQPEAITSMTELTTWENKLKNVLEKAEYQREREAFFLEKRAKKKLDLTNVNLERKEEFLVDEVRIARRMDKLSKLAASIAEIDNVEKREAFTVESAKLIDKEEDEDFDSAIIDINTKVRAYKKKERIHEQALDEVLKVAHLGPDVAHSVQLKAQHIFNKDDLLALRKEVNVLLDEEQRHNEEEVVRNALQEVLTEMGYDYGDGFEQTEYGPVAYAETGSNSDYVMRVQVNPQNKHLFTRLVARGNTTAAQDAAAEEVWCSDYRAMQEKLEEKGVETTLEHEAQPGEYPLDRVGKARTTKAVKQQHNRRRRQVVQRRNA